VAFFERIFKVNLELYTEVPRGSAHIRADEIFAAQLVIKYSRHAVFKSVLKEISRVCFKSIKITFIFSFFIKLK
jgi:hypothetical protein